MSEELLGERFVLLREVGSGGVSTVYLGRDEVLDCPVAVKVLKPDFEGSEAAARFRREGRAAAKLSHPNIAQVYDAGEDMLDGREVSYIVTEYLSGGDLRGLIQVRGRLTEAMLARIGTDAAYALAHAHEQGVVHSDVKPQNILMDSHGTPKLTDFGIAHVLDSTRTGTYPGTPPYSSPERLLGERITPKSDVYSLGVTLYEAATGAVPFTGSDIEVADGQLYGRPVPPRERGAAIGETYEAAVMSCLARDPDDRPTAPELRAWLLGQDVSEAGPSVGDRAGTTLKVLGAASAAGVSRALGAVREAGTALRPAPQPARGPDTDEGPVQTASVGGRGFGAGLNRRAVLLAAAALVLIGILAWVAISAPNSNTGDTGNGTGGEAARKDSGQKAEKAAGGGADETTQAKPEETEPAPPVDTADDVVFEMYVMATENDYEGSWNLLSTRYQEEEVGSLEEWEARQASLTGLTVTEEFVARPAGENQAKVAFQTEETRDGVVEAVSGVWTCVNEDGEWRLDSFTER